MKFVAFRNNRLKHFFDVEEEEKKIFEKKVIRNKLIKTETKNFND